jgi:hypothetical protein
MRFFGGRVSLLPIHEIFYQSGNEEKFFYIVDILSRQGEFRLNSRVTLLNEPIFDDNNVLIGGKIGRKSNKILPTLIDGYLSKIPTLIYPYVFYIIDIEEQVILAEFNHEAFHNELSLFDYLTKFFNRELWKVGLEVKINPLTSKGVFWDLISEAEKIYTIHFTLNSPNMLGVIYNNLRDMLKHEKEESNANRLDFIRTNEAGELKVPNNQFNEQAVGWAEDGAGEWKLKIASEKTGYKKKTIRSTEQLSVFEVDIENEVIEDKKKVIIIKKCLNLGKHSIKRGRR